MLPAYDIQAEFSAFSACYEQLEHIIHHLASDMLANEEHGQVEDFIRHQGNELLRRLLQAHLDLRSAAEVSKDDVHSVNG